MATIYWVQITSHQTHNIAESELGGMGIENEIKSPETKCQELYKREVWSIKMFVSSYKIYKKHDLMNPKIYEMYFKTQF